MVDTLTEEVMAEKKAINLLESASMINMAVTSVNDRAGIHRVQAPTLANSSVDYIPVISTPKPKLTKEKLALYVKEIEQKYPSKRQKMTPQITLEPVEAETAASDTPIDRPSTPTPTTSRCNSFGLDAAFIKIFKGWRGFGAGKTPKGPDMCAIQKQAENDFANDIIQGVKEKRWTRHNTQSHDAKTMVNPAANN